MIARISHLYVRDGGELKQVLLVDAGAELGQVEVRRAGGSERFRLEAARLVKGERCLPIRPVEAPEDATVVLESGAEAPVRLLPQRRWRIHVIHSSHQDPGFLDVPSKLRERFLHFLDDAVRHCAENPRF